MISNLMVLNSSTNNSRDITWNDDPDPKVAGYNIYRAFDHPSDWKLLNPTPHPGHFYRDMTVLTPIVYTLQDKDWVSFGNNGQWTFKVPTPPIWSDIVRGRSIISNHPDDITLTINGQLIRVGRVDGQDGLVTLTNFNTLFPNGSTNTQPSNPLVSYKNAIPDDLLAVVEYKQLTNFVDIFMTGVRTYYSVVPVLEGGQEQHLVGISGSSITNSTEVDTLDYMQAEMVRRNSWIFEQVGEPAFLLIRRTKGPHCGCIVGNGEPRTGCPSCYETGIIGGYYGPFDILFIDPDVAAVRTLEEGGAKVERAARSYLGRTPIIASGDLIVRRNGDRMVINSPIYKTPRGVLLQQDFDVQLLQRKDTRYLIPLSATPVPEPPTLYDPRFEVANPQEEPVTNPLTDPTKTWENPTVPKGRTIVFGNIET